MTCPVLSCHHRLYAGYAIRTNIFLFDFFLPFFTRLQINIRFVTKQTEKFKFCLFVRLTGQRKTFLFCLVAIFTFVWIISILSVTIFFFAFQIKIPPFLIQSNLIIINRKSHKHFDINMVKINQTN